MPTILILGAGPRIGLSLAEKFKSEGYTVVLASRNPDIELAKAKGYETVSVNAGDINGVREAFKKVSSLHGIPNVVVYNAMGLTYPGNFDDPYLTVTPESFAQDMNANAIGAFTAMQETLLGWKKLEGVATAFIVTGSILPYSPLPLAFTLGAGKSALAHLVTCGAQLYGKEGHRFYYVSQVTKDGTTLTSNDQVVAEAHVKVYWDLVNQQEQGKWDVRFCETGELVVKDAA
ncbi:hypothetical protein B7463_g3459, partial [Scytalidium lignicola]